MSSRWPLAACLFLTLAGCSTRKAPDIAPEDNSTHLGSQSDLAPRAWLAMSRAELAELAARHKAEVDGHLERLRRDPGSATLLPGLSVPAQGAVFQQAAYRPDLGFSLPDYVKGAQDAAVAAHLVRHRDLEAAAKLGGPKVEGKGYPVEWARAVGWALTSAQFKLASGDIQAAADLVVAHRQLLEVLDDEATRSDLGAVLLSAGRRALFLAARAWRDPKVNRTALAADLDQALAGWGDVPAPRFPALDRASLAGVWGAGGKGNALVATGHALPRVLDLLGSGLPPEGVMAVGAFLDDAGRLAELQYAYRPGLDTLYREPADLAYRLEERGLTAGKEEKTAGTHRQPFGGQGLTVDVLRTNRSAGLGAVVRVAPVKGPKPAAGGRDPRDFGPAHLDRTYEACRLRLDPRLTGVPLTVTDRSALERLTAGLGTPLPTAAVLERDGELVGALLLSWDGDLSSGDAAGLIAGLWSCYGCPAVGEFAESGASGLAFRWDRERTGVVFRLPFDARPNLLSVTDASPKGQEAQRLTLARQRDEQERRERIAAGKADERLTTGPGVLNDVPVPGLKLGATKEQAAAALPAGMNYRRTELADGVSVVIATAGEKAPYWAKQVLVRYTDGKVAEIRVRYVEPTGAANLKSLTADPTVGPGSDVPADWAALWADRPGVKAMKRVWRDDRTERTYQRDDGGSEVTWRAAGAGAGPWRFVTAGPAAGLGVGATKAQLVAAWGPAATTSGSAEVYRQPARSPYEMVLVWFDGDKAARLVGVHRSRPSGDGVDQVGMALQASWGRDFGGLGYIRRQEPRRGNVLGGLYWHDDAVRVHSYVQEGAEGLRQLTEWRAWPFAVRTPVAAR